VSAHASSETRSWWGLKAESARLFACPDCRGPLRLEVEVREGQEVIRGALSCVKCGATYPVVNGIPRLLPSRLPGRERQLYNVMMAYYDAYAPLMDRCYHNPRIAYMRQVEDACIRLTRPKGLVLDIGCGTGRQALMLAELSCRVIAIDISSAMLVRARREAARRGLLDRLELVQASASALPFRPGIFSRAYSIFGAYNHVPKLLSALRQLHAVLRRKSLALLTILNKHQLTWWVDALLEKRGRQLKQRLASDICYISIRYGRKKKRVWTRLLSPGKLRKALELAGFRQVRIGSILIFLKPKFSYEPRLTLVGPEKALAELEERLRWIPPFNCLGAYLIALAEKS